MDCAQSHQGDALACAQRLQARQIGALAEQMHGDQRLGARRDGALGRIRIDVEGGGSMSTNTGVAPL